MAAEMARLRGKTWPAPCCYHAANASLQVYRDVQARAARRRRRRKGGGMRTVFCALLIAASGLAHSAEISGHIDLTAEGKALRAEEAQDAIVYFRPKAPPNQSSATPNVMGTRRKQFMPRILAITVGSKVRFPNEDPILHNAFSTSKDNAFDVGLYAEGEGETVTFSHVGYVRVYCNVHHSMIGQYSRAGYPVLHPSGRQWRIPPGRCAGGGWRSGGMARTRDAMARGDHAGCGGHRCDVHLEFTQRRMPVHMNKFGKPYGRDNEWPDTEPAAGARAFQPATGDQVLSRLGLAHRAGRRRGRHRHLHRGRIDRARAVDRCAGHQRRGAEGIRAEPPAKNCS